MQDRRTKVEQIVADPDNTRWTPEDWGLVWEELEYLWEREGTQPPAATTQVECSACEFTACSAGCKHFQELVGQQSPAVLAGVVEETPEEIDELRTENRRHVAARRAAAQTLIAEIGTHGPESVCETAARAAAEIRRIRAELNPDETCEQCKNWDLHCDDGEGAATCKHFDAKTQPAPEPEGTITPEQVERLKKSGRESWKKTRAALGGRPAPEPEGDHDPCSRDNDTWITNILPSECRVCGKPYTWTQRAQQENNALNGTCECKHKMLFATLDRLGVPYTITRLIDGDLAPEPEGGELLRCERTGSRCGVYIQPSDAECDCEACRRWLKSLPRRSAEVAEVADWMRREAAKQNGRMIHIPTQFFLSVADRLSAAASPPGRTDGPCDVCPQEACPETPPDQCKGEAHKGGEPPPCPLCKGPSTADVYERDAIVKCTRCQFWTWPGWWQSLPRRSAEVAEVVERLRAISWGEDDGARMHLTAKACRAMADKLAGSAPAEPDTMETEPHPCESCNGREVTPSGLGFRACYDREKCETYQAHVSAPAEPAPSPCMDCKNGPEQQCGVLGCDLWTEWYRSQDGCPCASCSSGKPDRFPLNCHVTCPLIQGWKAPAEPSPDVWCEACDSPGPCNDPAKMAECCQGFSELLGAERLRADVRTVPSPDAGELANEMQRLRHSLRLGINPSHFEALDKLIKEVRRLQPEPVKVWARPVNTPNGVWASKEAYDAWRVENDMLGAWTDPVEVPVHGAVQPEPAKASLADCITAAEAGYIAGHNDTAESCYGDPGEVARDLCDDLVREGSIAVVRLEPAKTKSHVSIVTRKDRMPKAFAKISDAEAWALEHSDGATLLVHGGIPVHGAAEGECEDCKTLKYELETSREAHVETRGERDAALAELESEKAATKRAYIVCVDERMAKQENEKRNKKLTARIAELEEHGATSYGIADTLSEQLAAERRAHEETRKRVAELEAGPPEPPRPHGQKGQTMTARGPHPGNPDRTGSPTLGIDAPHGREKGPEPDADRMPKSRDVLPPESGLDKPGLR